MPWIQLLLQEAGPALNLTFSHEGIIDNKIAVPLGKNKKTLHTNGPLILSYALSKGKTTTTKFKPS